MTWLINDILRRLQEFVNLEIRNEELQKPPFDSYTRIIQELNEVSITRGRVDKEVIDNINQMIRNQLATLVKMRIEKIMRLYALGREIPDDMLMIEERRFITPLLELRLFQEGGEGESLAIVSFRKGFPILNSVKLIALGSFDIFDVVALPKTDAEELRDREVVDIIT